MALLTHDGLDGLLMAVESARLSEEQLANANRLLGVAVVRAPRTARVVKRRVEQAEEPVRARQAAAKRPKTDATAKNPGVVPAKPRSPDEKRKLSRQMAAFMRYGVLVLPADVKLNKKVKKADGEVLEGYRKSFNLQLQLVFGESVRAWAHVNNWFYLHAVLLRMATDGAVNLDPEAEAALEEGALLRKASDQQNAQWRLNELRLKHLGVKKEQLTKLFRQVAEGRPIMLPPPPREANWAPSSRARIKTAPNAAPAAVPAPAPKAPRSKLAAPRAAPAGYAPAPLPAPLRVSAPRGPRTGRARSSLAAAAAAGAAGAPRYGASLLSAGTLPVSLSLGFGPSCLGLGLPSDGAPALPRWPSAGGGSRGTMAPTLGQLWPRSSAGGLELLAKGHASAGGVTAELVNALVQPAAAAVAPAAAATAAAAPGGGTGRDEEVNAPAPASRRLLLLQHAMSCAAGAAAALEAAAAEGAVRDVARISPCHGALLELQRLLLEDVLAAQTPAPPAAAPRADEAAVVAAGGVSL